MRKIISILAILLLSLSLAVTAFATDDFVGSVGEDGTPCDHHDTTLVDQKDPGCSTDGYTGDVVCKECGDVIEEGEVIHAPGHQVVDGVCIVCGAPDVPNTGDNSHLFLWVSLMAVAVVGLLAVVGVSRKKA